jgi:hypothetical protein
MSLVDDVKVLALDISAFNMVMGPVEEILIHKAKSYKTYKQMLDDGDVVA